MAKLCGKAKEHGLWPQGDLGSNPGPARYLPYNTRGSFNLSKLQFPQMRGLENMHFFYIGKTYFPRYFVFFFLYRSVFYK